MKPMARRTLLRGLGSGAAVSIALPWLEAMVGRGQTMAATIPQRYCTFFWSLGMDTSAWTPVATGKTWALTQHLAPFAAVKSKLSVLTGFRLRPPRQVAHVSGPVAIFTGDDTSSDDFRAASVKRASFDQLIADHISGGTKLRSIEVRASHHLQGVNAGGTAINHPSHRGPNAPNVAELNPQVVFSRLFGDGSVKNQTGLSPADKAESERVLASRKSILDAVNQDANRMKMRVGASDRARLDQHLDSIRSLEKQIAAGVGIPALAQCKSVTLGPGLKNEEIRARNLIMSQLLAMAFACDLTRVATFAFSTGGTHQTWPEMGMHEDMHEVGHARGMTPDIRKLILYWMENFATFLQTLDGISEGAGTLLDNMIVMGTSDHSSAPAHSLEEYPLIVAGSGQGKLRMGQHIRIVGASATRVPFTIMKSLGMPLSEWGLHNMRATEVVSDLMV